MSHEQTLLFALEQTYLPSWLTTAEQSALTYYMFYFIKFKIEISLQIKLILSYNTTYLNLYLIIQNIKLKFETVFIQLHLFQIILKNVQSDCNSIKDRNKV